MRWRVLVLSCFVLCCLVGCDKKSEGVSQPSVSGTESTEASGAEGNPKVVSEKTSEKAAERKVSEPEKVERREKARRALNRLKLGAGKVLPSSALQRDLDRRPTPQGGTVQPPAVRRGAPLEPRHLPKNLGKIRENKEGLMLPPPKTNP